MSEKLPTLSDEPVDEPVMDESAEREALQTALVCLVLGLTNDAIDFLEKSDNPKSLRLIAKLFEISIYKKLHNFDEVDPVSGKGISWLKHDSSRFAYDYVRFSSEQKGIMSQEANELASKMLEVEAAHSEVFKSAEEAKEYYELLGDQQKVSEIDTRIGEGKSDREYGKDNSHYIQSIQRFVEETKDFDRVDYEKIDQQVAEVRDEVEQLLREVRGSEIPNTLEQELSQEQVENILKKVIDLNKEGIPYTGLGTLGSIERVSKEELYSDDRIRLDLQVEVEALREEIAREHYERDLENIKSIFEKGNIGVESAPMQVDPAPDTTTMDAKQYREYLHNTHNTLVHFNITGRHLPAPSKKPRRYQEREYSGGLEELKENQYTSAPSSVTLLFDLEGLTEILPSLGLKGSHSSLGGKKMQQVFSAGNIKEISRPYLSDSDMPDYEHNPEKYFRVPGEETQKIEGTDDDKELVSPRLEYGFVTSPRIAPRRFTGIVLSALKTEESNDMYGKTYHSDFEMSARAKDIANVMRTTYQGKENLLIPIYDNRGNLLWPEQMSHEEIQQLKASDRKENIPSSQDDN